MGKRREGREAAVQFLFQQDLHGENGDKPPSREDFWALRPATAGVRAFGDALIEGVLANREQIDAEITKYTTNYKLERIAAVDRNILRVAVYEMLFRHDDVPPVVCINEAIEIAKRFGSEESGRFVNGILDRVKQDVSGPLR